VPEITVNQRSGRSGAQLGTTARTTAGNDLAATYSSHPGTEAMAALANKIAGLKRAFHDKISKIFMFPVWSGSDGQLRQAC